MPTISQQPIDVQWVVSLASGTSYVGKQAALNAAVALSAANSNAPVQMAEVIETATAATSGTLAQVNMPSGAANPTWVVQLANAGTVYPLATALTNAYALSASNSNAPVNISRVEQVVTAP